MKSLLTTLVILIVMLLALAAPSTAAAEGKLLAFNFNGLALTLQIPTLDSLLIPITITIDPCKILGNKVNGFLGEGAKFLGLGICQPTPE